MKKIMLILAIGSFAFVSCKKKGCTDETAINYSDNAKKDDGSCLYDDPEETGPFLIVKLHFDSTQVRLDNFGNPATIPANHSAQSPVFHAMSAHYIELAPINLRNWVQEILFIRVQRLLQVDRMLLISTKLS